MLGLVCLAGVMLRYLGTWLVVDDPLEHAAGVVVLGGGFPWRAAKAAELYNQGWAKEVWLTEGSKNDRDKALEAFGMPQAAEFESGRWLLRKQGVPDDRIRIISQPVDNTYSELKAVLAYAGPHGRPVIVVTSKAHTRRVRVIWNSIAGSNKVRMIVRSTPSEPYDQDHWWRTTTDALVTFRETSGF